MALFFEYRATATTIESRVVRPVAMYNGGHSGRILESWYLVLFFTNIGTETSSL
jgi:hypothetical protein